MRFTSSKFEKLLRAGMFAGLIGVGAGVVYDKPVVIGLGVAMSIVSGLSNLAYDRGRRDTNEMWGEATSAYWETHDELEKVKESERLKEKGN